MTTGRRAAELFRTSSIALASLAGAAYGTGILIGLVLRLPASTPSVLWPPNALLTAFLLLVVPRRWPAVFLGAAVAHFTLELGAFALPLVIAFFVTNCLEAVIAALFVRAFNDAPIRFDTIRRTALFVLGGGLLAPFLSSFADAAAVTAFTQEDYWTVWKTRFLSNVLAQLAVVPAVVGVVTTGIARVRQWTRDDWTHAALIVLGFVIIAVASWDSAIGARPIPFFMPLLLWSAVRFGPTGAGLSIVTTVLVTVAIAVHGDQFLDTIPPDERVPLLQIFLVLATIPLMCVAALVEERQRAEQATRANDALKSAILSSIASLVVVLDREGMIITTNEGWDAFARRHLDERFAAPGAPYLDVWTGSAVAASGQGRAVVEGIRSVLAGSTAAFTFEHPWELAGTPQWWTLTAVPLQHPAGGAVVTHSDATARRLAELDAQRHREQMARTARTLALRELTSSLWHRLSQPLTGIMGNAQAGRRFVDLQHIDRDEIRHIFVDIVSDTLRATQIVGTLRDALREGSSDHDVLDLNAIVRDMTALVADEAVVRNVLLRTVLGSALPPVRGERLLVQQVVLHLIMNALEVLSQQSAARRLIVVTTARHGIEDALISISDNRELSPAAETEDLFEPFITMRSPASRETGLGLSISRAIVQAHGGRIWIDRNAEGGMTVNLTFPGAAAAV